MIIKHFIDYINYQDIKTGEKNTATPLITL